jgi:DNA transposition AAA+ family ATPase
LQRIHKKAFVFQVYSKTGSVVTVSGSSGEEDIGKSVANCKSNEVVTGGGWERIDTGLRMSLIKYRGNYM